MHPAIPAHIHATSAPTPPGPFSHAVVHGQTVYVSGQVGIDPATGQPVDGGIVAECRQALSNIEAIAEASGARLADAVKVNVYLRTMADFAAMNSVYGEFFAPPFPARATVQSDIDFAVEIEAVIALSHRAPPASSSVGSE